MCCHRRDIYFEMPRSLQRSSCFPIRLHLSGYFPSFHIIFVYRKERRKCLLEHHTRTHTQHLHINEYLIFVNCINNVDKMSCIFFFLFFSSSSSSLSSLSHRIARIRVLCSYIIFVCRLPTKKWVQIRMLLDENVVFPPCLSLSLTEPSLLSPPPAALLEHLQIKESWRKIDEYWMEWVCWFRYNRHMHKLHCGIEST